MKNTFLTFTLILLVSMVWGQSDSIKAINMTLEAMKLMDDGEIDKSIDMLYQAKKLDTENIMIDYEISYAYFLNKDYENSLNILKKISFHKDATFQYYQMMGNVYDIIGNPDSAFWAYDKGLERFPNSGRLYFEKGVVLLNQEKYMEALESWEKGIEVEPTYPSNYYWAARLYCNSRDPLWGILYGEIFMNLERGSKRTAEMSKLLYDTYKKVIIVKNKSSVEVKFVETNILNIKDTNDIRIPFSTVYETSYLLSCLNLSKKYNMDDLCNSRGTFIDMWTQMNSKTSYEVVLFDFMKTLKEKNLLNAYSHWILMQGDMKTYNKWDKNNAAENTEFFSWFKDNPLEITSENYFHRNKVE